MSEVVPITITVTASSDSARRIHHKRSHALRQRLGGTVMAGALLIGGVSAAHAALTTPVCLAKKLKEWGSLRKCQTIENGKDLQGKPADPAKCETKFQDKLAKITQKATDEGTPCRYRDNGDGTVTDFDTGLQWERKGSPDGIAFLPNPHDVDNRYTWSTSESLADGQIVTEFLSRLNGSAPAAFGIDPCVSVDGTTVTGGFADHCDWRLPSIAELKEIVDPTQGTCGGGSGACIDPIFGSTVAFGYWSVTTDATNPIFAWDLDFFSAFALNTNKGFTRYVRAVRAGL